jgi:uncharacterized coiled-coil protein SlyX
MKQLPKLEERITELEQAARINLTSINEALTRQDWEAIARLSEGLARLSRLRHSLGEFLAPKTP